MLFIVINYKLTYDSADASPSDASSFLSEDSAFSDDASASPVVSSPSSPSSSSVSTTNAALALLT